MGAPTTEQTFFRGKRPWSRIKDQVLGSYLPAYLAKVGRLARPVILIDAFAGPGKFDDGSAGSPLMMCQVADKYLSGRYFAIFVNRNRACHRRLEYVLGDWISSGRALAIRGKAQDLLSEVHKRLAAQTVFVYVDPFGLLGSEWGTILPFLQRSKNYSTEILINISMPTLHRLAARRAVATGRAHEQLIRAFHRRLTLVLGGDYWKGLLWNDSLAPDQKEQQVMGEYLARLKKYLPYTGACPVREREEARTKYYITFCSRHPDALLLMNDNMCSAYFRTMHEVAVAGTLFEDVDWREARDVSALRQLVLHEVSRAPGRTRSAVWLDIVESHFMRYTSAEFRQVVQELVDNEMLLSPTPRKTKRLNDRCLLYPAQP